MRIAAALLLFICSLSASSQTDFERYFTKKILRFDFMLAGNAERTTVYPLAFKEEPFWAGPSEKLTDHFGYGNFRYEVFDAVENRLIFSRGFSSLYQEWQTTAEAKKMERSFYEVATMPFPLRKIRFVLSVRDRNGSFSKLYETFIDPSDYFIRKEKPVAAASSKVHDAGEPGKCVDIAFIAEGYTKDEMDKFRSDVRKMAETLFSVAPFSDYRDKINIWAVEAVSLESGTDIPGEQIYINTALNSSFYTFDLDRYLTTQDIKAVNDYAAVVPHDNIVVLINSPRYGGGGVYNYYSGTTVDNPLSPKVFIHELGHGFAGLADEYYTSEVTYEEFYPLDVEPWEPNITTMVNFDSKWKTHIDPGTPVPTPPEDKYAETTGLFEGGGYSVKGIYRSQTDCLMKGYTSNKFCRVCQKAIREMIEFYTR